MPDLAPDAPPPSHPLPQPAGGDAIDFLLRLGRALHIYGYPSPSLETALTRLADRFGLVSQFFSTPTSLFSAFGPITEQRTFLQRVEPGEVHLQRLTELHEVIRGVEAGSSSVRAASARIDAILTAPPPYPAALTTLAFGFASGGAAFFLGGGIREAAQALAIGWAIGLLALLTGRRAGLAAIFEPLAAALAAFLAAALAHATGGGSVFITTLAGLIVLLPGFTLTVALTELATRHLASGTARLAGAASIFLTIGFGVAAGNKLATTLFGPAAAYAPGIVGPWPEVIALVIAPLAFVVLLRAPLRDAPWILLTGVLAVQGGRLGAAWLGAEMGVFLGALLVGAASHLYERALDRPSAVTLVPGILLLVPGSIGFRSLAQLMEREVVLGLETLFRMAFVAISLVAGLLVANALAPHRRGRLL